MMWFFTESELSRDEREMCKSAWEFAVKYTGRERVQPGTLPVRSLRRVTTTNGATNVLGSAKAPLDTSGMDGPKNKIKENAER